MTLETLITLLTIENNIIKNYFVIFELCVTGTAFSILEMFFGKSSSGNDARFKIAATTPARNAAA